MKKTRFFLFTFALLSFFGSTGCELINPGNVAERYEETVKKYERDRNIYLKIREGVKEDWDKYSEEEQERLKEIQSKAEEIDEKIKTNIERIETARRTGEKAFDLMKTVISAFFDWRKLFTNLWEIAT